MKHRFAYLMFAGLTLAAGSKVVMSAAPVPHPDGYIDILVDGVAQRRYAHEGRWYVEARKGKEYAIRMRNPYPVRVAVALSVDGLNTIDARQTTAAAARKWVLEPYETVTISGWQTSQTEARRFEFTTEERSYGHALGKTANLGVISAVFFKERRSNLMTEASKDPGDRPRRHRRRRPRRGKGLTHPRTAQSGPRRSTRPPGWADARTTPSPRCGWISRTRRRRP